MWPYWCLEFWGGSQSFPELMYPCFSVYVTIKMFLFCEMCHYWVAVQFVEDLLCLWWGSASRWCVYVVCLSAPFSLATSRPTYIHNTQNSIGCFFKETLFWRCGKSAVSFCNFSLLKFRLIFKQSQQLTCFVLLIKIFTEVNWWCSG